MSKITISMSDETNKKLKALAKDDERSLSKYLERGLIYLANIPGGYHTQVLSTSHDTPGGISTPIPTPASTSVSAPAPASAPIPTPIHTLSSKEELAIRAEQIKEESPAPAAPRKFRRPDGEPFEISDFEHFLPADTVNDDTYKTLKKKIPSLQFITILREGASRPLDDFVKYLKEEYIFTIESALGYSPAQNIPPQQLRALAEYLQPHVP